MTEKVFVDSNVLVYARDASEPEKQPLAAAWMRYLWEARCGCLSFQVLQEFYVIVTQKLDPGMRGEAARRDVEALFAWSPLSPDAPMIRDAWQLEDRYSLSWWDALIVSAARAAGCNSLLSEDLQDGQDYQGVRVLNPFLNRPPMG